jgi:hypothetical protein
MRQVVIYQHRQLLYAFTFPLPARNDLCLRVQVVAVGRCNHKEVCASCSLRMRLLYEDKTCPLCKLELQQVACSSKHPVGNFMIISVVMGVSCSSDA